MVNQIVILVAAFLIAVIVLRIVGLAALYVGNQWHVKRNANRQARNVIRHAHKREINATGITPGGISYITSDGLMPNE